MKIMNVSCLIFPVLDMFPSWQAQGNKKDDKNILTEFKNKLLIISLFDSFRCIYIIVYQTISNTEVKWDDKKIHYDVLTL